LVWTVGKIRPIEVLLFFFFFLPTFIKSFFFSLKDVQSCFQFDVLINKIIDNLLEFLHLHVECLLIINDVARDSFYYLR
jgi:hypothetical protein